jgi:hypothetical protein
MLHASVVVGANIADCIRDARDAAEQAGGPGRLSPMVQFELSGVIVFVHRNSDLGAVLAEWKTALHGPFPGYAGPCLPPTAPPVDKVQAALAVYAEALRACEAELATRHDTLTVATIKAVGLAGIARDAALRDLDAAIMEEL